jgi:hypothetical protein
VSERRLPLTLAAVVLIGGIGCSRSKCATVVEWPNPPENAGRKLLPWVEVEKTPLPAPPATVPVFEAPWKDAWRLSLEAVAIERGQADETTDAELREWSIEGWMPRQARRKAAFDRARARLRDVGKGTTDHDAFRAGIVVAATLLARMEERIALDWTNLRVVECEADPTACRAASRAAGQAMRAWLERAVERYEFCETMAGDADTLAPWKAHCAERLSRIGSLRVLRGPEP